jgi:hypothetical protein
MHYTPMKCSSIVTSQSYLIIIKFQWNPCENYKTTCMCKIHEFQNVKTVQEIHTYIYIYIYNFYINDVYILLVIFWCEICMIYILLNLCNFPNVILYKIIWLLCIKYEHSCMWFNKKVSFFSIFEKLNMYK